MDTASLLFNYLDTGGTLGRVDLTTARVYRWTSGQWTQLTIYNVPDQQSVSAAISAFGTYAVMAEREEKVYLPVIRK